MIYDKFYLLVFTAYKEYKKKFQFIKKLLDYDVFSLALKYRYKNKLATTS